MSPLLRDPRSVARRLEEGHAVLADYHGLTVVLEIDADQPGERAYDTMIRTLGPNTAGDDEETLVAFNVEFIKKNGTWRCGSCAWAPRRA